MVIIQHCHQSSFPPSKSFWQTPWVILCFSFFDNFFLEELLRQAFSWIPFYLCPSCFFKNRFIFVYHGRSLPRQGSSSGFVTKKNSSLNPLGSSILHYLTILRYLRALSSRSEISSAKTSLFFIAVTQKLETLFSSSFSSFFFFSFFLFFALVIHGH